MINGTGFFNSIHNFGGNIPAWNQGIGHAGAGAWGYQTPFNTNGYPVNVNAHPEFFGAYAQPALQYAAHFNPITGFTPWNILGNTFGTSAPWQNTFPTQALCGSGQNFSPAFNGGVGHVAAGYNAGNTFGTPVNFVPTWNGFFQPWNATGAFTPPAFNATAGLANIGQFNGAPQFNGYTPQWSAAYTPTFNAVSGYANYLSNIAGTPVTNPYVNGFQIGTPNAFYPVFNTVPFNNLNGVPFASNGGYPVGNFTPVSTINQTGVTTDVNGKVHGTIGLARNAA